MILVATARRVYVGDPRRGLDEVSGLTTRQPSSLAADRQGRAWAGTEDAGVFVSDDEGRTWTASGLEGQRVTALTASPAADGVLYAGTEPSGVWRSGDGGASWTRTTPLETLASSPTWAFPPRPDTHHVRWIACHPSDPDRLWVAVEAGALVQSRDGGRTWQDRVDGGPHDTHELAVDGARPDRLHVAAGDGYFESPDGGQTWVRPRDGLDVPYLRSVVVAGRDPAVILVSGASHAHAAYSAGRSDGRVYRRVGEGRWERVTNGWPDPPTTVAPLLATDPTGPALFALDERGVHWSDDTGATWAQVAGFPSSVRWPRALAPLPTE